MLAEIIAIKKSAIKLRALSSEQKNQLLQEIADSLLNSKQEILNANQKNIEQAKILLTQNKINQQIFNRLILNEKKINNFKDYSLAIIKLVDPVGKILSEQEIAPNLILTKLTTPLGVIAVIFESRPEVVVQVSLLGIKSGNGIILKGGSESKISNKILFDIINEVLIKHDLGGVILNLDSQSQIAEIIKYDKYIDLIIPRGGKQLVSYLQKSSLIPVLGHSDGICHSYISKSAGIEMAINTTIDGKCNYPTACNALETLLVHEKIANSFWDHFMPLVKKHEIKIYGDLKTNQITSKFGNAIELANDDSWSTEYSDLKLNVKIVTNVDEAIEHINNYGSKHTDVIITNDELEAKYFKTNVDSACVFHNCSTRFSDGFVFGLGAEVAISTAKIHARGPVGLDGLMTSKWELKGTGQIKAEFENGRSKFTHKLIK